MLNRKGVSPDVYWSSHVVMELSANFLIKKTGETIRNDLQLCIIRLNLLYY